MKKIFMLIMSMVLVLAFTGCGEAATPEQTELLIDVNQLARISPEELNNIMGEPESTEAWNYQNSKGTFPTITYYFQGGKYEFLVIDNMVVRMNIHSDKYNDGNAESIKYLSDTGVLEMLGIDSTDERITKTADTGVALRFSPVSDTVADVWCSLMDKEKGTIDEIKVTFNLNYFD